jgi:hypothetical protein
VELESSEKEKKTAAGLGLPVAGAKVVKPEMVNVVGVVHGSRGSRVGKAAVSEREERARRRSEGVYILKAVIRITVMEDLSSRIST